MEEVYQSTNYKSAWRPLTRENDLSAINTSSESVKTSGVKTSVKTLKKIESVGKPGEDHETTGQNDVLKKLAAISADISSLSRMLLDQQIKMDQLLSLLQEKEPADKKNVFGLLRK